MNNAQELFEDIQDKINKIPFTTINGKTGVILRKYHWSIKSQINLIKEALKDVVENEIFILEEDKSEFKYICIEPTPKNLINFFKIEDIVKNILEDENQRVKEQIENLLLLHK